MSCGACVSSQPPAQQQAPTPVFDPAAFFVGHTHGEATLKIAMHPSRHVIVEGQGRLEPDGTLILDQSVQTGTAPARHRHWLFRRDGPGRWSGSLSDAAGPVSGDIVGNRLHLAFAMDGGLQAQQWLFLQAGGGVVRNIMVVRKWGVPVARLDETITRRIN